MLIAKCLDEGRGLREVSLNNADSQCRMNDLNFISNVNGYLQCDPEATLETDMPTQATPAIPYLQCSNSTNSEL